MPAVYMPDTNICSDITREFARVAGLRVEDWVAEDQAGWPAPAGGQDPIPDMAGAPGFEPGMRRSKPRALTTWPRPKLYGCRLYLICSIKKLFKRLL